MDKRKKADLLLDEIGEIDDSLIHEAEKYRSASKSRTSLYRALAGIAAILILTIGLIPYLSGIGNKSSEAPSGAEPPRRDVYSLLADSACSVRAKDETEVFVGGARLAFSERGSDEIFYIELSNAEYERLCVQATYDGSKKKAEKGSADLLIWLVSGDDRVYSPHLAHTRGNISVRDLYYYEDEYIPSDKFRDCVEQIISGRT